VSDTAEHLNDREKAAALEDLTRAFREEYWQIEDHWLTIDGGADVSDETVRVLTLMMNAVRSPE
jgi:hypothetical protein